MTTYNFNQEAEIERLEKVRTEMGDRLKEAMEMRNQPGASRVHFLLWEEEAASAEKALFEISAELVRLSK